MHATRQHGRVAGRPRGWHTRCFLPAKGRAPRCAARATLKGKPSMLWTIFVILLVLWLLGMVSSYTMGGFIHLLLVLAIAVVLIRVIQGRSPV
jgi:Family of unknown function (DUF5670)